MSVSPDTSQTEEDPAERKVLLDKAESLHSPFMGDVKSYLDNKKASFESLDLSLLAKTLRLDDQGNPDSQSEGE